MIAQVAQRAGKDPLTALGLIDELPWTVDITVLIHELLSPPKDGGKSESEYDAQAHAMMARMDLADSWTRATRTGYTGPRGQLIPDVPQLPDPEPAPLTECVFTPTAE